MPPPSGKTQRVIQAPLVPKGPHTDLALEDATADTLTPPGTGVTYFLLVQVDTEAARYTLSPISTPTATHGFQLSVADIPILLSVEAGAVVKFIGEGATSVLQYQWFGIDSQAT